jgi:AcrR family transcriptional regulator
VDDRVKELSGQRVVDRGEARRQAFLKAAREVFLEQGYEAASVNDIIRRAGGSMATLYAQFGNKEGLFLAVAQEQHERVMEAMTPECVDHLPLEEGLQTIGEQFLRVLLEPDTLAMFRVVIGEGRNFPEDVRRIIFSGGEKVRAAAAAFMRSHGVASSDPDAVAAFFLDMLRSRHHFRALADLGYRLSNAEIAAHVRSAVRFFIAGLRSGV